MVPRQLERAVFHLLDFAPDPLPRPLDRTAATDALRTALELVERRDRRRKLMQFLRACAEHLVLKGDESE
jgi:hypothetical protein